MRGKPELLVPAGGMETLKCAIFYGADAVYVGGEEFGLRANAINFSNEELDEGVKYAHAHGVKVYVTANIFAHNEDMDGVKAYFKELAKIGPDALIISDPGVFALAREYCRDIDLHISTQANNTNYGTFLFWKGQGAKRVVTARELTLSEIGQIKDKVGDLMEIESFVHGAMCISYSGRCLLSNYFTGRDGNKGECTHPCRWQYAVAEQTRPGEYLPIEENERGTFIFNSKDLCMIGHIPELIDAGIDSFKIEGRMKNALYVATTARAYRKAIDDFYESKEKYAANMDWYLDEVSKCSHRLFATGFYFGKPSEEAQIYDSSSYVNEYSFLGIVEGLTNDNRVIITQRNKFCLGDEVEILRPDGENSLAFVRGIYDEDGNLMENAPHAKQRLFVDLTAKCEVGEVIRARKV